MGIVEDPCSWSPIAGGIAAGITTPAGFQASGGVVGLKPSDARDLAVWRRRGPVVRGALPAIRCGRPASPPTWWAGSAPWRRAWGSGWCGWGMAAMLAFDDGCPTDPPGKQQPAGEGGADAWRLDLVQGMAHGCCGERLALELAGEGHHRATGQPTAGEAAILLGGTGPGGDHGEGVKFSPPAPRPCRIPGGGVFHQEMGERLQPAPFCSAS